MTAMNAGRLLKVRLMVQQGLSLATVGLLAGGLAGWLGQLLSNDVAGVAQVAAAIYLVLSVLWPLALAALTLVAVDEKHRAVYGTRAGALTVLWGAAGFGGILGTALFILPAINVPVLFGGRDSLQMWAAVTAHFDVVRVGGVLGVTLLAAGAIALWAQRQAQPNGSRSA